MHGISKKPIFLSPLSLTNNLVHVVKTGTGDSSIKDPHGTISKSLLNVMSSIVKAQKAPE